MYTGPDFNPHAFAHVDTNNLSINLNLNSAIVKNNKQMAFVSRDDT